MASPTKSIVAMERKFVWDFDWADRPPRNLSIEELKEQEILGLVKTSTMMSG